MTWQSIAEPITLKDVLALVYSVINADNFRLKRVLISIDCKRRK